MVLASHLSDRSLGAVLTTALDGVVVMSMDGLVVGWNQVAERTFGWTFEEAMGHRMGDLIVPPQYREAHEKGLSHYLATGDGPVLDQHLELTAMHKDGREIPVELSITHTEQFGTPVFLGFLRDISERHDAERRQELMIGELNHRVKNLLGVVSGIAYQTGKAVDTVPEFIEAFSGRLVSLGRAHEILTAATWERAPLRALLDELTSPYRSGEGAQITLEGPDLLLQPRALIGLSMIVHELITNAVKYGALSSGDGTISIQWRIESGSVVFNWQESGSATVAPPTRQGFGTRMISRSASHDLGGEASFDWSAGSLYFRLAFPIADQGAAA